MGGVENNLAGLLEPSVRYHSCNVRFLTLYHYLVKEQFQAGSFDWGGRLPNGNGGAQRFPLNGLKSYLECKGIRKLDCETYKSSRDESRS